MRAPVGAALRARWGHAGGSGRSSVFRVGNRRFMQEMAQGQETAVVLRGRDDWRSEGKFSEVAADSEKLPLEGSGSYHKVQQPEIDKSEAWQHLPPLEREQWFYERAAQSMWKNKFRSSMGTIRTMLETHSASIDTANRLLSQLKMKQRLRHMQEVFRMLKYYKYELNARTYGLMLSAYAENGMLWHTDNTFKEMLSDGISPTLDHFRPIILSHVQARDLDGALRKYEQMKSEFDIEPNDALQNIVLNAYTQSGAVETAEELFNEIKDSSSDFLPHRIMTRTYAWANQFEKAEALVKDIKEKSSTPEIVYNTLLSAYRKYRQYDKFDALLAEMLEKNLKPTEKTSLIVIQAALDKDPSFENLKETYMNLKKAGVKVPLEGLNLIFHRALKQKNFAGAEWALEEMQRNGLTPRANVFNALSAAFAKNGNFEAVQGFLNIMDKNGTTPNTISWNTLMTAYNRAGKPSEVISTFYEMKSFDIAPDEMSYACLFGAIGRAERDQAHLVQKDWIQFVRSSNLRPLFVMYASMVFMYSRWNMVSEAETCLEDLMSHGFRPSVRTLTPMVLMYNRLGDTQSVRRIMKLMKKYEIEPDDLVLSSAVYAESIIGDYEGAMKWLSELDLPLTTRVLFRLVRALGVARRFEELRNLVEEQKKKKLALDGHAMEQMLIFSSPAVVDDAYEDNPEQKPSIISMAEVAELALKSIEDLVVEKSAARAELIPNIIPLAAGGDAQAVSKAIIDLRNAGLQVGTELAVLLAMQVDIMEVVKHLDVLSLDAHVILQYLSPEERVDYAPKVPDETVMHLLIASAVLKRETGAAYRFQRQFQRNGQPLTSPSFTLLMIDAMLDGDIPKMEELCSLGKSRVTLEGFAQAKFYDFILGRLDKVMAMRSDLMKSDRSSLRI